MQARYYDPVIGRFYSNDPVGALGHLSRGSVQGINRYNYAYNNPYKYIDPNGENPVCFTSPWSVVACIAVAAGTYGAYKFGDEAKDLGNAKLEEMEADRIRQEAYINCVRSGGRNCDSIASSEKRLPDIRRKVVEQAAEAIEAGCVVGTTCGGSLPSRTEENAVNGFIAMWQWITGGDDQDEPKESEQRDPEEKRK